MSEQLIIAGFHRSGTSLVARLLHGAGLFLGYELLGAHPSNPQGHFEDREVLNLHQQILADNERDMFVTEDFQPKINEDYRRTMRRISERRDAEHELWGFKEPRVSLFLPDWKEMLPQAKVLIIYRHFSETTYSLAHRHSAEIFSGRGTAFDLQLWETPDIALKSWLVYNKALLKFAETYPRDSLTIALDTLRDGFPLVPALNHRWDLGLVNEPGEGLRMALSDKRARQPIEDPRLVPEVEKTWQTLEDLGGKTERMLKAMYG